MKILMLSNVFPPGFIGGFELGALDVLHGLRQRGHEVRVLTSDYFPGDSGLHDVHRSLECALFNHELPALTSLTPASHNFRNIRVVGSHLRDFEPDIVLVFNLAGLGSLSMVDFLRATGVPTVLYLMDDVFSGTAPERATYDRIFGTFDLGTDVAAIVMSENVRREVNETVKGELRVEAQIPGWVDVRAATSTVPAPAVDGHRRFVYLSVIRPHKGTDLLLDASARLVDAGWSDFDIDVYGNGEIGTFLRDAAMRGVRDRIHYRGVVDKQDVVAVLSAYDALLFPTNEREPFGFVAVEAAAAGCLPILTAGIGAGEWLLDGYDCLKVNRTSDSLASAMQRIMAMPNEELDAIRHRTRESARRIFAFDRWLPLIERVCQNEAGRQVRRRTGREIQGIESSFLYLGTMLHEARHGDASQREGVLV